MRSSRLTKEGRARIAASILKTSRGYMALIAFHGEGVSLTEGPETFPRLSGARTWVKDIAGRYGFRPEDFSIHEDLTEI